MSEATTASDVWGELAGRDWSSEAPFALMVDGDLLRAEVMLRHLPGRRLAVRARWRGETVFAKLFFAGHQQEARREAARHGELLAAGLAVPALRHESQGEHGAVVITDWVTGESGQAALRGERGRALVENLLDCLFSLYHAGLRQRDLHLDNFLFDGERFLIVDAGAMAPLPAAPRRAPAIRDNLALFCAQAPLDPRDVLIEKVRDRLRREGLEAGDFPARVRRRSNRRLRSAMKKWRRESSAIGVWREHDEQWLYQRALSAQQRDALAAALRAPESLPLIKKGSRVSVYGDDLWVIKHYREGGAKARLRARFFRTRADISWVMGWTWTLLGVPTPRPVMLRRRADGGAAIAFPRVAGTPLSVLMENDRARARRVAPKVECWLSRLGEAGFWHGDAKAQNILLDADDQPVFIDLDGAGFSVRIDRRRRRAARDLARFQRNWTQFQPPGRG